MLKTPQLPLEQLAVIRVAAFKAPLIVQVTVSGAVVVVPLTIAQPLLAPPVQVMAVSLAKNPDGVVRTTFPELGTAFTVVNWNANQP